MAKETVQGDLKAAIDLYRKAVKEAGSNRALAAKALLRVGECYEKLGDTEARKAYEQIVREFGDQKELVDQARARLASLGPASSSKPVMTMRKLSVNMPIYNQVWSISDDGRYGSAEDDETGNVAVINLATGETHDVTQYGEWDDSKGFVYESAISRDGKQIAFWHFHSGATNGSLRVIGVDGKAERVLYRAKVKEWGRPMAWSPDGKYIALQLERGERPFRPGPVVTDFALVAVADGALRILRTYEWHYYPKIAFSPDGRYVAYDYPSQKDADQGGIYVVATDGSRDSTIAPHRVGATLLGWMPDGSILFASERAGSPGVWRVKVAEGKQAGEPELVKSDFRVNPIGITRNGACYYSTFASISKAYTALLDPQTGKLIAPPAPLTQRSIYSTSAPAWSADGQQLAYVSRRGDMGPNLLSIRSADGSERDVLPHGGLGLLRWHPDGRSVLAVGDGGGLYRIDTRTGEAKRVVSAGAGWKVAEWSPDRKYVFIAKGKEIARKDIASGQEKVLHTSYAIRGFSLSPDSRRLAFLELSDVRSRPLASSLMVMSIDGGSPRLLATPPEGTRFTDRIAWTPDGRYILGAYQKWDARNHSELWIFPTDGGEARKSDLVINAGRLGDLSVHPDGKRIAYSVSTNKTEFWVMENFLPGSN